MKKFLKLIIITFLTFSITITAEEESEKKDLLNSSVISGLKCRLVGPGLTSGRISDIAVNPQNHSIYYITVACGGVWKTTNSGTTFKPIFDGQKSFSIGCVTIDPCNPNVIWIGSGENNSQRSVSYGDGIYKSCDGGKTWKNMGLKESKHIGKIIIDPRNSDIIYVAAFGPLWGSGGERGLYKSTNGGETWELSLEISENTGVSDIVMDPTNPDVMWAASYQRRRHVWTLIHGGPEAALYQTKDAGKTWNKVKNGFPGGELGRIGLAISQVNPYLLWALVEANGGKGGVYKSTNKGASWFKSSSYNPGSAQYYQKLVCDPNNENIIYSLETFSKISIDGGKTFKNLGTKYRHVDDHALWIDPDNSNHLIIGGDGGLYETYDKVNWHHFGNIPVTQFYRISCDNTEPFYYVYGGTQDNNTWGVPSQTNNSGGITNEDWFQLVGGDGYQSRSDPENPDIIYCQWQYGNLMRYDRKSGELTYIQPQPEKGEEHRWNWDTPLIISPHSNTRLYFASNRLYKSDDMGNSWNAISPDLTRKIDRNQLEIMGRVWHPEAVAKNASTSLYGNIVSLSESPVKQGLIAIGTDDGLIQISNDDGTNWEKISTFSGVPDMTYVSDVFCSAHNENVIYATFNNHKRNDYKPYVLKSNDKGKSWTSINGNLPEDEPAWVIYEDFKDPNLLFVGTEFSLYFSIDGGEKWIKISSGLPPIAIRDLEIQQREIDLVIGTFGRGIYILDDFSPLRDINEELLENDFHIFPIKDALIFNKTNSRNKNGQGSDFYRAKNPKFGAVFTYYLKEGFKTKKAERKKKEKGLKEDEKYNFPSWEELKAEDLEEKAFLIFEISDASGKVVRRLTETPKKGINRFNWDLAWASKNPVSKTTKTSRHSDFFVMPGKYSVTTYKSINGKVDKLFDAVEFNVKPLNNSVLIAEDQEALAVFREKITDLQYAVYGAEKALNEVSERISLIKTALKNTPQAPYSLLEKARELELQAEAMKEKLSGDPTKSKRNANQTPTIKNRVMYIIYSTAWTSSKPTKTAEQAYEIIKEEMKPFLNDLRKLSNIEVDNVEKELQKLDAPWTPGRIPYWRGE